MSEPWDREESVDPTDDPATHMLSTAWDASMPVSSDIIWGTFQYMSPLRDGT